MSIPDYAHQLRVLVGPEHLLWLPGVNAIVVDGDGCVLLHRRSDNGVWSLLSGILDPGEEPADGVVREVFEETGVRVRVERLTGVTVSPPRVHPNGDRAQYLELVFLCTPVSGEAHVHDEESVEVAWFPRDGLPRLDARSLQKLQQAISGSAEASFLPPAADIPGDREAAV
ncbi:NUDIX hydrolase [Streptomyces sp. NPDC052236]|uniref:NUDIX hydrolase n=1 Tax=Streptomyces sp. NPDC052236 TaxID=3365686 RepID=UPI0037D98E74